MAKKINIPKEELQEFVDQGLTQQQIADKYECATITIKKRMKQYDIEASGGKPTGVSDDLAEVKSEIKKISTRLNQQDSFVMPTSFLEENTSVFIQDPDKKGNYRVDGSSLVLLNNGGDINIEAGSFGVISTGVSLNIANDHIAVLEIEEGAEHRCLTIVGPIQRTNAEQPIKIVLANYHGMDSYNIVKGEPIARLHIVMKSQVDWVI